MARSREKFRFNRIPLDSVLSQINPIHIISPYFIKSPFNIASFEFLAVVLLQIQVFADMKLCLERVVPDVSKRANTFTLRVKQSKKPVYWARSKANIPRSIS
jgi:hypothetical protein